MREALKSPSDQFSARVAKNRVKLVVRQEDLAIEGDLRDANGGVLENFTEARFAFADGFFGAQALELCDILTQAGIADDVPAGIAKHRAGPLDPTAPAALGPNRFLNQGKFLALGGPLRGDLGDAAEV